MRIRTLELRRYGHFVDCRLDFPASAADFHLILGANEAGKSTTLAAVTDLLCGFPPTTPYAFRHATSQLRVAGMLEAGDTTLEVVRRKGHPAEDAAGRALDTDAFPPGLSSLRGLGREAYLRTAALDHERLREGGRDMLNQQGDLGQALFAAGTGLRHLPELQRDLAETCDGIWGERRKKDRRWYLALDALEDARRRAKDALVLPAAWAAASRRVDALLADRAALEARRSALAADQAATQRVRRLFIQVQRRAALNARVAAIPPSPFTPGETTRCAAALQALAAAMQDEARMGREAAALDLRLATMAIDPTVPAQAAAIEALVRQASQVEQGMTDAAPLRRDLAVDDAAVARHLASLGWADVTAEAAAAALPDTPTLARLDVLAKRHALQADRAGKAASELRRTTAALAAEHPGAAPDPTDDGALGLAQQAGQRAMTRHDGLHKAMRGLAQAEAALAAAMARLLPWHGDPAALAAIAVPAEAEIAAAGIAVATTDAAAATRAITHADDQLAHKAHDRQRLETAGLAVSLDALVAARHARGAVWDGVRRHLLENAALHDPAAAVARLDQAMAAADALADRRFDRSAESAHLQILTDETAALVLTRTQAARAADQAAAALATAQAAWTARLADAGLPAMAPERLRAWAVERAVSLEVAAKCHQAEGALDEDRAAIAAAEAALAAILGAGVQTSLPALLDLAAATVTRRAQAATTRAAAAGKRNADRQTLQRAQDDLAEAAAALQQTEVDWAAAGAGTRLTSVAPAEAEPVLHQVRALATSVSDAARLRERVQGIDARTAAFTHRAAAVAALCNEAPGTPEAQTQALDHRLFAARSLVAARNTLDEERAALLHGKAAATRAAEAARETLAPLETTAGGTDLPLLETALERIKERRLAEADLRAIDREIMDSEGLPLDQALATVEGADLAAAIAADQRLGASLNEVHTGLQGVAAELSTAQAALTALDRGSEAAAAAADVEMAAASLAAEAEDFVLRRAELVLIEAAIERYRQRQQNPLLERAGVLFATLTLNRYSQLQVDRSGRKPRLIALRGEEAVDVHAMSQGTADQLFLALRLAAFEQSLAAGAVVPFLADDLFVNFDDARAEAGFRVLGELARRTQVLFFTHHDHLREIAERALHPDIVYACALGSG